MKNKNIDAVEVDLWLWNISVQDDNDSFRRLFEYYYPALCLYAKRFIADKESREDIVQDVFFSIWENRKRLSVQVSARSYLITSVRNHCLNFLRRKPTESYEEAFPENMPVYGENENDLYTLNELQDLLTVALAKLPEAYRRVFELNRLEDKSYGEIAEEMNLSIRTVERYKNKAIEILKKELKDYLPFMVGWIL